MKVIVLLNKLLKNWFDEIFLVRVNFSFFSTHTVWYTQCGVNKIFVSWFSETISVKTTSLVKIFAVKLVSRNIFQVIQKFRKLHATLWYSVWHLVVEILFKFLLSQNHFSLEWLNLDSNKNSFAHYIMHKVQNIFYLLISLASAEKDGSEWGIISP